MLAWIACVPALLLSVQADASQSAAQDKQAETTPLTSRYRVQGGLQFPDGSPATGAQVIDSHGYFAFADEKGSFSLEAAFDPLAGTQTLEITANQGTQGHALSWPLPALAPNETVNVGVLVLEPTTNPQYQWLPAMGERPGVEGVVRYCLLTPPNEDGDQEAIVGGLFDTAGAMHAQNVARWDGARWHAYGDGLPGTVHTLCLFDSGNGEGPELYAGGDFVLPGSLGRSLARWDGRTWQPVGGGLQGEVRALATIPVPGLEAPQLVVGGLFTQAGDVMTNNVAAWDGKAWHALGEFPHGRVTTITHFADGSSEGDLWVSSQGPPSPVSGLSYLSSMYRWNGSGWNQSISFLPGNLFLENQGVHSTCVWDAQDGFGPCLFVGGNISTSSVPNSVGVVRWNGSAWHAVGEGLTTGGATSLAVMKQSNGQPDVLIAGGYFNASGGVYLNRLAQWHGGSWMPLVDIAPLGYWFFLAAYEPEPGQAGRYFMGGDFVSLGTGANHIGLLGAAEGQSGKWSALGNAPETLVRDLHTHDDGTGTGSAVFVAGEFLTASGQPRQGVFKLVDGQAQSMGGWFNGEVYALETYDDGSGAELYASGHFTHIGSTKVHGIAKWDGSEWRALLPAPAFETEFLRALTVHDDGSGEGRKLYIGRAGSPLGRWSGAGYDTFAPYSGFFTLCLTSFRHPGEDRDFLYAGGIDVNQFADGMWRSIAYWDGYEWHSLGHGPFGTVNDICVYDDGTGPVLYVGGSFATAGGKAVTNLARWNGTEWLDPLPGKLDGSVTMTRVLEIDGKPQLVVGGTFDQVGDLLSSKLVRWDGTRWYPMATSMDFSVRCVTRVPGTPEESSRWLFGGLFRNSSPLQSHLVGWGQPE